MSKIIKANNQRMKKVLFILAIVIASDSATFAQSGTIRIEVINGFTKPNPNEANLMKVEEARHPNVTKSMHDLENATQYLRQAPDDFGGHKAQALNDLKQAWISLRKALYYRILKDTN